MNAMALLRTDAKTEFEQINAAVRPAECHGPLNPKKKHSKSDARHESK